MSRSALSAFALLAAFAPLLPAADPKPRVTLPLGRDAAVESVAWGPKGDVLALAVREIKPIRAGEVLMGLLSSAAGVPTTRDTTVLEVWDPAAGKVVASARGDANSVAFALDGKLLAAGGRHVVHLWELKEGRLSDRGMLLCPDGPHSVVSALAFSSDGKTLASEGDVARLWDITAGKQLAELPGRGVYWVAFSPDGKTLATKMLTADGGDALQLWDVAARKERADGERPKSLIGPAAFSSDGKTLAYGSAEFDARGNKVVWAGLTLVDVTTGKPRATFKARSHNPCSVAFSPDGKLLASGGMDGSVKLWEVKTGKEAASFPAHRWMVYALAFSSDGKTLASSSEQVKLWDVSRLLDTGPGR
jgi:WD40 repeat protein